MRRLLVFSAVLLATPAVLRGETRQVDVPASSCALPESLERPIANFLGALDSEDYEAARVSLGILRDRTRSQGIRNLFPLSAALRFSLSSNRPPTRSRELLELLDGVIEIVPDDPWLLWQRGRLSLLQGFSGISDAFPALRESLQVLLHRNPRAAFAIAGQASFYLLLSLIGCILLVSLGILLRHFPLLSHDVGDLFPRAPTSAFSLLERARSRGLRFLVGHGANRVLTGALLAVLLALPIVAGAGLLPSACLWTLLLTPYLRPAERVGAVFSLISLALLPWLAAWSLLPGRALNGDGSALWTALQGTVAPGVEQRIQQRSLRQPQDPWAALARARLEARRFPLSRSILEENLARLSQSTPDSHGLVSTEIAHTELRLALIGCVDGAPDRERTSRAKEAYEQALRQVPGRPEVLEGLLLASALSGDTARTQALVQQWMAASPEEELDRIATWKPLLNPADACRESARVDRELRLPPLPTWTLYLLDLDPWSPASGLPFRELLLGRLPSSLLPVLGIAALLALLLGTALRGRLLTSSRCPRCGTVSCPSCNRAASGFDYCPTCLSEQVRPAFLEPGERISQGAPWMSGLRRSIRLGLGFLVPGLGQVLEGRPIRGTLFLLLLCGALLNVAVPTSPVVDPLFYAGVGRGLPLLPPIVLSVVFLLSALDMWRHGRR